MNERRPWTRNELRVLNWSVVIVFGSCCIGLVNTGVVLVWFGAYIKGTVNLCGAVLFGTLARNAVNRLRNG